MASDLSKLIQNAFTSTLNGLLAKDANIIQVTKAHPQDFQNQELLEVQSIYDFSTFSSKFSYFVPAQTSSLIFHTMMGSTIDSIAHTIDEDTQDAISEFISNTSGGFTTIVNSENFEDLGQIKFNIAHNEVIQGNDITNLDTLYRFEIDLENQNLVIFIGFDELILPYITELRASEITQQEVIEEEVEEEEVIEENEEVIEEKEEAIEEEVIEEVKEIDSQDKKLKFIIIAVASVLVLVILSFFTLYFLGTFDSEPEPVVQVDNNATSIKKDKNNVDIQQYNTLKKIDFKVSYINKTRLNNQLSQLTKFNVLNKEELEAQALEEKNRLIDLEREKELMAFSKKNQEEKIFTKEKKDGFILIDKRTKFEKENSIVKQNNIQNDTVYTEKNDKNDKQDYQNIEEQTNIQNDEVPLNPDEQRYVIVQTLKYSLIKSLVQQTDTNQARISICNDESGKTTIYVGPFESERIQKEMIELSIKQNQNILMNPINITEEEFNLRCNPQ